MRSTNEEWRFGLASMSGRTRSCLAKSCDRQAVVSQSLTGIQFHENGGFVDDDVTGFGAKGMKVQLGVALQLGIPAKSIGADSRFQMAARSGDKRRFGASSAGS